MLKSLTVAIALLAAPIAASVAGLESTAHAQSRGGGGGGAQESGGGGDGITRTPQAVVSRVPDNEYNKPTQVNEAGCPTPASGRSGPKRFIGPCGPH
jgi:hypothetical protein